MKTLFFTQTCFFLGVRRLDDPAFGHSCYCGSFHILVRPAFFYLSIKQEILIRDKSLGGVLTSLILCLVTP